MGRRFKIKGTESWAHAGTGDRGATDDDNDDDVVDSVKRSLHGNTCVLWSPEYFLIYFQHVF